MAVFDQPAPGRVDEVSRWFHPLNCLVTDQEASVGRQRRVESEVIALGENSSEIGILEATFARQGLVAPPSVHQDAGLKGLQALNNAAPNPPRSDDPPSCAG